MPENVMQKKETTVPFSLPLSRLSIPPFLPLSMSLLSLTSFSLQTTHCEAILPMQVPWFGHSMSGRETCSPLPFSFLSEYSGLAHNRLVRSEID